MDLRVGIGFSHTLNAIHAAQEAAMEAKAQIYEQTINLAIVFSTVHYDPQQVLTAVNKILGTEKTIGCSTAGIILSDGSHTRGVGVLVISSFQLRCGLGALDHLPTQETEKAGHFFAQQTLAQFGSGVRSIFLFLSDGKMAGNTGLLKGLQEVFGNIFPIVGAGACDDFQLKESFQFFQDYIMRESAVGAVIGGPVAIGVASRHGWRPLGKPRFIDKADGNIIRIINGKKATGIYEEFFGNEAQSLFSTRFERTSILYPLGINVEGSDEYLVRNAVSTSPDGSIICQGDVPAGLPVHLMIGNKDSCLTSAQEAAKEAQRNLLGKPAKLVIIFESLARLKLLGRNALEEINEVRKVFGPKAPIFGMYSFGEVCPLQIVDGIKKPLLQNESITIVSFG